MLKKRNLILQVFEENMSRHKEKTVFEYLEQSSNKRILSFDELFNKSQAIAAYLKEHTKTGDRVLLSYLPGLEFTIAFLGCLYAGVIAVPAYPLRSNHHAKRFLLMLEDCQPRLICGTRESLKFMQQQEEFSFYEYVFTEELDDSLGKGYISPIITPSTLAFLQYTSGSTGLPKGVMVTQENIISNEEAIHFYYNLHSTDTLVSWLPVQHDMGMIGGLIYTLYTGMTEVFMSPATFLSNPYFWLKTINDYQASTSGGPNFGYELCVERIEEAQLESLDLSSWKIAFNGSEPVRSKTLEAFVDRFERCGFEKKAFLPCYGMAETTLLVSGKPYETEYVTKPFEKAVLVSSGTAYKDFTLKIVNPDLHKECPEGEVGEIWINGPSIAQGYWQKEQATEETFHAQLPDDERHYLRTGDLGFLNNNELYITGRLKDLIILQGRNIYPQDVEMAVGSCHPAVRDSCIAAFSVEIKQQEQLIVVAEIERTYRKIDFEPVFQAIRAAVSDKIEAIPYSIQLLSPGQTLKTTSGKIQRQATRQAYLDHSLSILASDDLFAQAITEIPGKKELEEALTILLKKVLAIDTIDRNARYTELGGTSLQAVLFQQQLQAYLGDTMEVAASIILDYPTIAKLVDYLYGCLNQSKHQSKSYTRQISFSDNPIAVVGMACRFPGNSNSPEAFWTLLKDGGNGIGEIPKQRWNWHDYAEDLLNHQGGFIDNIEFFAPEFFNISPREAASMDPQQRLLLETTWKAFENAGIVLSDLTDSDAGVFVGATTHEYGDLLLKGEQKDSYVAIGNSASALAGRIAYTFGLQGPCLSIDTACSSSLVALYEACNSLQLGETSLAIVGGVNALLTPEGFIQLSKANMLSKNGYCNVFSTEADGYVRGEGCGIVLLKRLKDAQRDNNTVLGVIKSAVINQDGASSGFTVPNGASQEKLIRQALNDANLSIEDIDYIEAHGTGTVLGDPMETNALAQVFAKSHQTNNPLVLGSVKANVGHLEAAAGMAGLIKVILSMQNELIPAQLHIKAINPKINLNEIPAVIPLEAISWPRQHHKMRYAGVSSFGFTGTNAHVIIEEAPKVNERDRSIELPEEHLFVLSAKSRKSLNDLIIAYCDYLKSSKDELPDICYSAALGRTHFNYRIAFVTHTKDELCEQLQTPELQYSEVTASDETISSKKLSELHDAWLQGKCIDWNNYYGPYSKALRKVSLPTYCFDQQYYWPNIKKVYPELLNRTQSDHVFLGARLDISQIKERVYESLIHEKSTTLLSDHVFYGTPIFAFAAYLSTVIEAVMNESAKHSLSLSNIMVDMPLLFKENETRLLQTIIREDGQEDEFAFSMLSRTDSENSQWLLHATGKGIAQDKVLDHVPPPMDIELLKKNSTKKLSGAQLYAQTEANDVHLGIGFQWINACFIGENQGKAYVLAKLKYPETSHMGKALRHAGYLDAGFVLGAGKCLTDGFANVCVPINVHQYSLGSSSLGTWVYVALLSEDTEAHHCEIFWCDDEGRVLDWVDDIQFRLAPKDRLLQSLHHALPMDEELLVTAWMEQAVREPSEFPKEVLWINAPSEIEQSVIKRNIVFKEVTLGKAWSVLHPKQIHLNKNHAEDYVYLLQDFATEQTNIIYDASHMTEGVPHIDEVLPLLYLIQALVALESDKAPILTVLTQNMYSVNGEPNVAKSWLIHGLLNSLMAEYPFFKVRQMDKDNNPLTEQQIENLLTQNNEMVQVWRENSCYVPRLRHLTQLQGKPSVFELKTQALPLDKGGVYLVTGGLGNLGLLLCEYLLLQGAKTIHLASRRTPDEVTLEQLKESGEKFQAQIKTHVVDVSQQEEVNLLISALQQETVHLNAIFHLAGLLDDVNLLNQTKEHIEPVIAGKALGAYYLHEATKDKKTPMVFFSSIVAMIGSPGQANYAMANAYLDGLSHYRLSQGLTSISIGWGPWEKVGMAAGMQSQIQHYGLGMMDKEGVFDLLNAALNKGYAHIGAASIHWEQLAKSRIKTTAFLSELMVDVVAEKGPLLKKLMSTEESERTSVLKQALVAMLRETLGFKPDMPIDADADFFNLGLDSLMAVTLTNKLQAAIGSKYPITVAEIFNYPGISKLSDFLAIKIGLMALKPAIASTRTVVGGEQEPIAIVGMGCRYPGGANSPSQFWDLLKAGYDGISDIPADRWNVEDYYSPDPQAPGKLIPRRGGFLKWPVGDFDAGFFNISPKQAQMMDPMHRLLLEVSWEALEDAAIEPKTLNNTETGVYVGVWHSDYADLLMQHYGESRINAFTNGTSLSTAAGVLSFYYGLKGPSYSVDAACSSSMVAMDGAVKGLQLGECDTALVAGANMILSPDASISFDKSGMLSPDGECRTFDESANGYARSEGVGVVVLKRLSDAISAGDRIYGVIKAVRINHNGPASGITVPNGLAQQELIENTLLSAKIKPEDVDYVECQGTGTPLGDPIEVGSLSRVFANSHTKNNPLLIGSVKSNLGHMEAAAAVGGLMKVLLSLQHEAIPANIHFSKLNSKMSIDAMPAAVVTKLTPWKSNGKTRIAGVSTFGATGINGHAILEEAPVRAPAHKEEGDWVIRLSAKTPIALEQMIEDYIKHLEEHPQQLIQDVVFSANTGRAIFECQALFAAAHREELLEHLRARKTTDKPLNTPTQGNKVALPTYPFQRQRYWLDMKAKTDNQLALLAVDTHPFLIRHMALPEDKKYLFETDLSMSWPKFMSDHQVYGHVVVAGAAYLSALVSLIERMHEIKHGTLHEVTFIEPAVVDEQGLILRTQVDALSDENYSFKISSFQKSENPHQLHVQGQYTLEENELPSLGDSLEEIRKRCPSLYQATEHLQRTQSVSYELGEHFLWLQEVCSNEHELLAKMRLPEPDETEGYLLHPGLLDACFQSLFVWMDMEHPTLSVPVALRAFSYDLSSGKLEYVYARRVFDKKHKMQSVVDIYLLDKRGQVLGLIEQLVVHSIEQETLQQIVMEQKRHLTAKNNATTGNLLRYLKKIAPEKQQEVLQDILCELVAEVLGIPAESVAVDQGFIELGLDSLMAVDLRNKLQQQIGDSVRIGNAVIFSYPDIRVLSDYLMVLLHLKEGSFKVPSSQQLFQEQVHIPERIIPSYAEPETKLKSPLTYKNMFITGATGVLGSYFLKLVLEDETIIPWCLVRAKTIDEGQDRLKEVLYAYEFDQSLIDLVNTRVQIILGDVTEPGLGLNEKNILDLANRIDVVVHCAGKVSLHGIYEDVAPVNVLGTQNMIEFTLKTKQKYMMYVSSYSVMGDRMLAKYPDFKESDLDVGQSFFELGYQQTKFEAELLVRQNKENGLKFIIVRPGNIFGDSITGAYPYLLPQLSGIYFDMLRTIIDTRTSIQSKVYYDITPVDYVAQGMLYLITQHKMAYGTYHLLNPDAKSYSQIVRYMQDYGYDIEWVTADDYRNKVIERKFLSNGVPYRSSTLDLFYSNPGYIYEDESTRADAEFTHSILSQAGITCPKLNNELLALYLKKMKQLGYLSV